MDKVKEYIILLLTQDDINFTIIGLIMICDLKIKYNVPDKHPDILTMILQCYKTPLLDNEVKQVIPKCLSLFITNRIYICY